MNWPAWLRRAIPFGVLEPGKPRHYREMMRVAWDNRDSLGYAGRILKDGVCDGCSLGPRGLKDDVLPGTHLCLTRLNLLRLNTMGGMQETDWNDLARLRGMHNEDLRALGRVPYPLVADAGDTGFRRIGWDAALDLAASWIKETPPARQGMFVTSRGLTNEPYYVAQKLARLGMRTNNVDLCSRLCHAPTVTGLKSTIGYGAPTCSLSDLVGTDLLILFGTDLPNNQPVTTKYMREARKRGTRILVVNPVREPGLERYWIPSKPLSALWGTKLMDDFYQVNVGGDVAFITGVLKALVAMGAVDRAFIDARTVGWDALEESVIQAEWRDLERSSGLTRADMERFAKAYGNAKTAVLCYSMGLTQHTNGVDNVRAIVNLCLARGNIGREKTGIMPIRGHSGVQGGGECGVDPHRFPGSVDITPQNARILSDHWGHPVPDAPGLMTGDMTRAILAGEFDLLFSIGGNLRETMPDPRTMERALAKLPYRIHQDIVLNSSSVLEPGKSVLVLPAQTRYEQRTGGTSTSTERRIRFTPEIPGQRIGEARPEWEIPALIGQRIVGGDAFAYPDTATIRREMARVMPMYAGIERLEKAGDSLQWGGPRLGGDRFPVPEGRARFSVVTPPDNVIAEGEYRLTTRRGKQFNSIVFRAKDAQMGDAPRDAVLLSEQDARALGVAHDDLVTVQNATGTMDGRVRIANVPRRHVVTYWPEGNVLIPMAFDPEAGIPDYNATVRVVRR